MRTIVQRPALAALVILLISWLTIRAGIAIGKTMVQPGDGFVPKTGITSDLFRFDAEYYFGIATEGYSYNGDPYSSPNIVFAPLFPSLVWLASWIPGLNEVWAGFVLNKIFLYLSLLFLLQFLRPLAGEWKSFWILNAMATSAGAYALHAYYSESTMLLCLSIVLWAQQKQKWLQLALASATLGASRLAALPITCVVTAYLVLCAWKSRHLPRKAAGLLALSVIAPLGVVAFLGYIAWSFGNPFTLFPQIQNASWGYFHPETSLFYIFSGANLFDFTRAALRRGWNTFINVKTLNLVWTLLALASVIYSFRKFSLSFFTFVFTGYFLFIYGTGGGSEFLISAHRFYIVMLPIFMMFAGLVGWIERRFSKAAAWTFAALLFSLNLVYCLLHTAFFNQGIWYYF